MALPLVFYSKNFSRRFRLQIVTDSTDSLEEIYRTVRSFDGVSVTKTHLVLRRVKNEHTIIPTK